MNRILRKGTLNAKSSDFTSEDFALVSGIAMEKFGLNLSEAKMPLVQSRISKRMRELGLSDFRSYRRILEGEGAAKEETHLLSVLTTNVTSFFRENHHFVHMRSVLQERLKNDTTDQSPVRIWSAASSTGQEAYSIAMVLADICTPEQLKRVKIVASDIDPFVVETGKAGVYPMSELDSIPKNLSHRFTMRRTEREFEMKESLSKLIEFDVINLTKPLVRSHSFDFIFCRNVAIYFSQGTQAELWTKLADLLRKNGTLYIGHSERIHGSAMSKLENCGITMYTRL